jgi:hypothetical protein
MGDPTAATWTGMSTAILRLHRCPFTVSCISIEESFLLVSEAPASLNDAMSLCAVGRSHHCSEPHIPGGNNVTQCAVCNFAWFYVVRQTSRAQIKQYAAIFSSPSARSDGIG